MFYLELPAFIPVAATARFSLAVTINSDNSSGLVTYSSVIPTRYQEKKKKRKKQKNQKRKKKFD
tara:strand:+ start:907 stop:1098 length:192 start_codon:yes stop_codon:yes gene_type:complete